MSNEHRPLSPSQGFDPYSAPESQLRDPDLDAGELVLATRGHRFLAKLIDWFIQIGVVVVVGIGWAVSDSLVSEDAAIVVGVLLGCVGFGALLVINLHLLKEYGQTLGKRWMGIAIVRRDGSQVSLARIIFLRLIAMNVVGSIPGVGPLISLLNLLMIFGNDRRCLHDHFADTKVIASSSRPG
jgi:uncharacterized RDD family membrane protein YckC